MLPHPKILALPLSHSFPSVFHYEWNKMDETIINIENEIHREESEIYDNEPEIEESLQVNEKDLPKRVLAFTTKNLMEQLGNNLKTSVDGTFKSSCSLWGQQFIWMN